MPLLGQLFVDYSQKRIIFVLLKISETPVIPKSRLSWWRRKGLALFLMEVTLESVKGFAVRVFLLVSAVLYRTHIKLFCRKYFITLNCLIPWAGVNK